MFSCFTLTPPIYVVSGFLCIASALPALSATLPQSFSPRPQFGMTQHDLQEPFALLLLHHFNNNLSWGKLNIRR